MIDHLDKVIDLLALLQHRARKMDPWAQKELQSSWRCKQAHYSGLPQIMGRHFVDIRQCWNVELEVWTDRESLPGTAALCQRSLSWALPQGRVQHARQHLALRHCQGFAQAPTIHHLMLVDAPLCSCMPALLAINKEWYWSLLHVSTPFQTTIKFLSHILVVSVLCPCPCSWK